MQGMCGAIKSCVLDADEIGQLIPSLMNLSYAGCGRVTIMITHRRVEVGAADMFALTTDVDGYF